MGVHRCRAQTPSAAGASAGAGAGTGDSTGRGTGAGAAAGQSAQHRPCPPRRTPPPADHAGRLAACPPRHRRLLSRRGPVHCLGRASGGLVLGAPLGLRGGPAPRLPRVPQRPARLDLVVLRPDDGGLGSGAAPQLFGRGRPSRAGVAAVAAAAHQPAEPAAAARHLAGAHAGARASRQPGLPQRGRHLVAFPDLLEPALAPPRPRSTGVHGINESRRRSLLHRLRAPRHQQELERVEEPQDEPPGDQRKVGQPGEEQQRHRGAQAGTRLLLGARGASPAAMARPSAPLPGGAVGCGLLPLHLRLDLRHGGRHADGAAGCEHAGAGPHPDVVDAPAPPRPGGGPPPPAPEAAAAAPGAQVAAAAGGQRVVEHVLLRVGALPRLRGALERDVDPRVARHALAESTQAGHALGGVGAAAAQPAHAAPRAGHGARPAAGGVGVRAGEHVEELRGVQRAPHKIAHREAGEHPPHDAPHQRGVSDRCGGKHPEPRGS
mmetsp:Transcript_334/g.1127  ORF Transcript_334/g.1127 Transcript_334/m.1127 type:complete len:492 (-) Transcript_334:669-2144(-)